MGSDGDVGKGKGKRKRRKYTMSAAALAQRRTAAWKTGEHAATALAQALPPCKRSLCPMTDDELKGNCDVKRHVETGGGALERCPVRLVVDEDVRSKLAKAMETGDLTLLAELQSTLLAGMHGLARQELAKLIEEGFVIEDEIFRGDGEGSVIRKTNPRAEPTLKTLDMLGATAGQQAITPKAAGERKRDEGVGGLLDIYKRRTALAGAKAVGP